MKRNSTVGLPSYLRFFISALLVIAATYLKIIFFNLIGPQTPFLLYLGIILIISRYLGNGSAFFGLGLCMIATNYFFMPPYYRLQLNWSETIQLLVFALEGYLIILISDELAKAIKKNVADSALFRAILEKSSDCVVVVNPEGKRTYCSPSVKNVIGYTDEEYLNLPPWELGHPEDVDDVKLKYSELINNPGSTTVLLHQMHHKNGHWIWVESRVSNLLNDPQIRAMIANFNDVTQRVERDQNRRDFIGIVSHELRSPLTNVKSYGQMLLKRLEGLNDGICTSFASKLIQQANYMEKMVVDLTDAATINAGRMQLFSSEFDFNLLIKEIAEGLQQSTNKHFLRIELCPMGMVYADKERLSQVITNMVSNAIKYSPSGGDILISSEVKNNSFFFHVKDSGIGIAEKDLQKVFYRLYRANKTTPIKGLGLGLYICHQIITLHNGEIGVESEEGKGSVFWFSLPLA